MNRTPFSAVRNSRIPMVMGECAANGSALMSYVNEAQQRLIQAGGEIGWWGGWARMVWNVDPNIPYIVAPREVARIIGLDICRKPVRIVNEFFEFLEFGIGLQRQLSGCDRLCSQMQALDRGTLPTLTEITPGNKLRLYITNTLDSLKWIMFSGLDTSNVPIYTLHDGVNTNGVWLQANSAFPFVDTVATFNSITGVQKDITYGFFNVYQVNPTTGAQSLIGSYAPGETSASYRKFFVEGLPDKCHDCDSTPGIIQITGMVKLEYIPVRTDTDFLLIGNIPALKEECQSIRFEEMDGPADAKAVRHHRNAIKLLNQELEHYLGKQQPAINFAPFGNARLEKVAISMI